MSEVTIEKREKNKTKKGWRSDGIESVRMSEVERNALRRLSEKTGQTKSDIIRKAVRIYLTSDDTLED